MNFLELCRRVREEVGYSGNGPSSVIGQVGEMGRLVNKVNSAWLEIQQSRTNWRFMRKQITATVAAGSPTLTIADMKSVDKDSFAVVDGITRSQLTHISRDAMRWRVTTPGRPTVYYAERGLVSLWPTPAEATVITGEYYTVPVLMASDNNAAPTMPEEYHEAIVWLAVRNLGAFEESGNTYTHASTEYQRIFNRMLKNETPDIIFGGSIA